MTGLSSSFVVFLLLQQSLTRNTQVSSFQPSPTSSRYPRTASAGTRKQTIPSATKTVYGHCASTRIYSTSLDEDADNLQDEEDFEMLFKGALKAEQQQSLGPVEKAWRYVKKPLLSIGAKGATFTHGNSLRQLLEAHTVVKVKVNTKQFGTLEQAFEDIKKLAVESGAPEGLELVQARDKDKIILFGMPGTLERLKSGDFPPPPRDPEDQGDDNRPWLQNNKRSD